MGNIVLLLLAPSLFFVILQKWVAFRGIIRQIRDYPGFRMMFPLLGWALFCPPIPYIFAGAAGYRDKYTQFARHGVGILSVVSLFPSPDICFSVADPDAVKEIISSRERFPKNVKLYSVLAFFGQNIVASEHDDWKKYRKISAPAFNEDNNRAVWSETVNVVNDLFVNVWGIQRRVEVENVTNITKMIAFFVLSAAGFGRRLAWVGDTKIPSGRHMTFKSALFTATTRFIIRLIVPKRFLSLFPASREVGVAFQDLEQYMMELIEDRKISRGKEDRHDIASRLIDANEDAEAGAQLTNQELLSNVFVFLLAGHETTAHTLTFTLLLLALHQDEQERVYQEITSAIPEDRPPTYQDLSSLNYVTSVLYETLRMFPSVSWIPKLSAEDTTVYTTNDAGEKVAVFIPKGAGVNINTSALHHNPKYWDDPETYKPSRFLGDWPRDAFLPFSGGARSCLGRRTTELESIAVITMIVRRYRITLKDQPQFASETFEQRKQRVLKAWIGLSLTPTPSPLVFTLRD